MGQYEKPFTLKALDSNFNLVALVAYSNLQWSRKFHEAGIFSVVVDASQYSTDWKYIYTEKRQEVGKITQVNWVKKKNSTTVTLSGYFLESELNNMVCYKKPTHYYGDGGSIDAVTAPSWTTQSGTADEVAEAFFEAFKYIKYTNYDIGGDTMVTHENELNIEFGSIESGNYHQSVHNRNNELLGNKLYSILKPSGGSFKVAFDYVNRKKVLNIVIGKDRTWGNAERNNPVLLSSTNGTLTSASIVTSTTNTKDAVVQTLNTEDEVIVLVNGLPNSSGRFVHQEILASNTDYATAEAFKTAVMNDARQVLYDYEDIYNFDFDAEFGAYEYLEDFDLGDLISVNVPEIGLSADVRIIACYEVVKNGVWSMSIEVGTPILRKRG